ncbi:MAG: BON domain-containing protein [Gemmataceae bacterium]
MGQQDLFWSDDRVEHYLGQVSAAAQICSVAENCLRHNLLPRPEERPLRVGRRGVDAGGCSPTYYLKQMAQVVVARLEGVQRIVNEIEVVAAARR